MKSTIIRFERQGRSVLMILDQAPPLFDPDSSKIDLKTLTDGTLVGLGQQLVKMLLRRDPVKTVLGSALSMPVTEARSPLYFHMRALAADAVPWEQLHVDGIGFYALKWPIGRIADRAGEVRARSFKPPLRVVAVLSAAGRDGRDQLEAIHDAVQNAGMPVELHVISGDDRVLDAAAGRPGVISQPIAANSPALCDQIAAAKPHVLHVLCHGGEASGVRLLNFGLFDDFDAARAEGSLRVSVADLVQALEACDPWLVVLSACETAAASDLASGRALAHDMVGKGVTAVIGMRRLVDLTATNRFCRALYPEVLAAIRGATEPAGQDRPAERTIDWASALPRPRLVMRDGGHPDSDSWLDPVLYVQNDKLRVLAPRQSPEESASLQGKLEMLRKFLAAQDPSTLEPGVLAEVQQHIAETEAKLAALGGGG
jgi:hypothetical protein